MMSGEDGERRRWKWDFFLVVYPHFLNFLLSCSASFWTWSRVSFLVCRVALVLALILVLVPFVSRFSSLYRVSCSCPCHCIVYLVRVRVIVSSFVFHVLRRVCLSCSCNCPCPCPLSAYKTKNSLSLYQLTSIFELPLVPLSLPYFVLLSLSLQRPIFLAQIKKRESKKMCPLSVYPHC